MFENVSIFTIFYVACVAASIIFLLLFLGFSYFWQLPEIMDELSGRRYKSRIEYYNQVSGEHISERTTAFNLQKTQNTVGEGAYYSSYKQDRQQDLEQQARANSDRVNRGYATYTEEEDDGSYIDIKQSTQTNVVAKNIIDGLERGSLGQTSSITSNIFPYDTTNNLNGGAVTQDIYPGQVTQNMNQSTSQIQMNGEDATTFLQETYNHYAGNHEPSYVPHNKSGGLDDSPTTCLGVSNDTNYQDQKTTYIGAHQGYQDPQTTFINSNQGYQDQKTTYIGANQGYQDQQTTFINSNQGYQDQETNYLGANQGYQDQQTTFINSNQGYQDQETNYLGANQGYQDQQTTFINSNQGYQDQETNYLGANQGYQDQQTTFINSNQGYQDQKTNYLGSNQGYQDQETNYLGANQGYQDQKTNYLGSNQGYQDQKTTYLDQNQVQQDQQTTYLSENIGYQDQQTNPLNQTQTDLSNMSYRGQNAGRARWDTYMSRAEARIKAKEAEKDLFNQKLLEYQADLSEEDAFNRALDTAATTKMFVHTDIGLVEEYTSIDTSELPRK